MRRFEAFGVSAIALFILLGCAARPSVILMPDESGAVGAVTVKTKNDFKVIAQAYHSVTVKPENDQLSEVQALSEGQVKKDYANVLKAQPPKPAIFILYFVAGSYEPTKESLAKIPAIIDKIKEHWPTEVSIIGHADSTGTDAINEKLSAERASAIEKIIKKLLPTLTDVTVKFFGSTDLLVATPPNVSEPRNRRVEIMIL